MSQQIHRHRKRRLVKSRIIIYHEPQPQFVTTLFHQGGADQSPPMLAHKIDHFRGNIAGGSDKIPFILPVFVIYHDYELPLPDIFNMAFNSCQHLKWIYNEYKINNNNAVIVAKDAR